MKNKVAIFALIEGVFLFGCASTKKSVWTGTGAITIKCLSGAVYFPTRLGDIASFIGQFYEA